MPLKQACVFTGFIMRFLFAFLVCFPFSALAENPMISASQVLGFVATDLTGNGQKEHIVLYDLEEFPTSDIVLTIWGRGGDDEWGNYIFSQGFAQYNDLNRPPTLSLAENGSVQVHSFSTSETPANWEKTLTIAHRQLDGREYAQYLVVGLKYEWNPGGNAKKRQICEINLLTGRGELTRVGDQTVTVFESSLEPEHTDAWPRDMIPEQCFGI